VNWRIHKPCAPIGIDIGRRRIRAVQLRRSSSAWRVEAAAVMPRSRPGVPIERSEIRELGALLAKESFRGDGVVLPVPADKLLTGILELPPRASGAPIEQISRSELARMHRCDQDSLEIACWDLPAPARAREATHVMAVGCLHADANALLDAFEAEGLDVLGLEVYASAAARACAPLLADVNGIAAILDIGGGRADLVLLYKGVVVYERKLAKGGITPLIELLANDPKLDGKAVRKLLVEKPDKSATGKKKRSQKGIKKIHAAIEAHAKAMIEEMRIPLSYLGNQYPDAAMERLLLIGGAVELPVLAGGEGLVGMKAHLDRGLEFDVRIVAPGDLVECPGHFDKEFGPDLTVAIGLGQFSRGKVTW